MLIKLFVCCITLTNMTTVYFIQDNRAEPFKVEIDNQTVHIYKCINEDNYIHILTYEPKHIFVGKSPLNKMTDFSGGHGDNYDGNSILLEMNDNTYIHIGCEIFSFIPKSKIVEYVSCVGNNWVPYPYAVDELGNYYLMIEDIVLLNSNTELIKEKIRRGGDPYSYYYARTLITVDKGRIPPKQPKIQNFKNIEKYYIDDEDGFQRYTLRYDPDTPKEREWNFPKDRKKKHYIKHTNSENLIYISETDYFNLMEEFGALNGFEPLHKTMIQPRLF